MSRCKCKSPKRIKNSAGGVDFFVCAKSKGGCGQEIDDSLDFGTINPYDILDGLDFECPECAGAGTVVKRYPSGLRDVTCSYCKGTGKLDDIL